MQEKLRFLGLDVHAETIAVAVAEPDGEVRSLGTIPNRVESIRKLIKKLGQAEKMRACYEAGPTGVVKQKAKCCDIPRLAPQDLRRTCARLCHEAGGELEQIQFLLGHVSAQTTERYLGCKQRFRNAVNDLIGLEPTRRDLQRFHPASRSGRGLARCSEGPA